MIYVLTSLHQVLFLQNSKMFLLQVCGVCLRLLSQRSPWSSYHMDLGSAEYTVVGVLVCGHVYHVECLDQATQNSFRQDPTYPQCGFTTRPTTEVVSIEPLPLRGGGTPRANGFLVPTTCGNKLSRIGVVTYDLVQPKFRICWQCRDIFKWHTEAVVSNTSIWKEVPLFGY